MTDTTEPLPAKWRVVLGILTAPAITALVTGMLAIAGTLYATKLPSKPAQAVIAAPAPIPPACDIASLKGLLGEINSHAQKAHGYSEASWARLQILGADHRNNRRPKPPAAVSGWISTPN